MVPEELLTPMPEAEDLAALNQRLLRDCVEGRHRTIRGKSLTVAEGSEQERGYLQPLVEEGFPLEEVLYPLIVDGHGRVKVKTNWYSTPLWAGVRACAVVFPEVVEIKYDNRSVARHARCYGRDHQILDLEHYLDVLEKKPGAKRASARSPMLFPAR